MHTALTFPRIFPGSVSRPTVPRRPLPAILRRRLFELSETGVATLQHRRQTRAEKRLFHAALREGRVLVGSAEEPYEPLVLGGAPLIALRAFGDLELTVTTGSPDIREQVELLVELDHSHAVTVDFLISAFGEDAADLEEQLSSVAILAAEGITTRLVIDEPPMYEEAATRRFFALAFEQGVFDVVTHEGSESWQQLVQQLRLEYGFPRRLPGRG